MKGVQRYLFRGLKYRYTPTISTILQTSVEVVVDSSKKKVLTKLSSSLIPSVSTRLFVLKCLFGSVRTVSNPKNPSSESQITRPVRPTNNRTRELQLLTPFLPFLRPHSPSSTQRYVWVVVGTDQNTFQDLDSTGKQTDLNPSPPSPKVWEDSQSVTYTQRGFPTHWNPRRRETSSPSRVSPDCRLSAEDRREGRRPPYSGNKY